MSWFTTALGLTNVDTILDFNVADDTLALDDRILYSSATGQILFDADGNGAGGAVLFATVSAGTVLTATDFIVI